MSTAESTAKGVLTPTIDSHQKKSKPLTSSTENPLSLGDIKQASQNPFKLQFPKSKEKLKESSTSSPGCLEKSTMLETTIPKTLASKKFSLVEKDLEDLLISDIEELLNNEETDEVEAKEEPRSFEKMVQEIHGFANGDKDKGYIIIGLAEKESNETKRKAINNIKYVDFPITVFDNETEQEKHKAKQKKSEKTLVESEKKEIQLSVQNERPQSFGKNTYYLFKEEKESEWQLIYMDKKPLPIKIQEVDGLQVFLNTTFHERQPDTVKKSEISKLKEMIKKYKINKAKEAELKKSGNMTGRLIGDVADYKDRMIRAFNSKTRGCPESHAAEIIKFKEVKEEKSQKVVIVIQVKQSPYAPLQFANNGVFYKRYPNGKNGAGIDFMPVPEILEQMGKRYYRLHRMSKIKFDIYEDPIVAEPNLVELFELILHNKSSEEIFNYVEKHPFLLINVDGYGHNALHIAALSSDQTDVAAKLIENCQGLLNQTSHLGWTPFFMATCSGNLAMVKFLVDFYRDPFSKKDVSECNPVLVAITHGRVKVLEYFIVDKNQDFFHIRNYQRSNSLLLACRMNQIEVIKFLLPIAFTKDKTLAMKLLDEEDEEGHSVNLIAAGNSIISGLIKAELDKHTQSPSMLEDEDNIVSTPSGIVDRESEVKVESESNCLMGIDARSFGIGAGIGIGATCATLAVGYGIYRLHQYLSGSDKPRPRTFVSSQLYEDDSPTSRTQYVGERYEAPSDEREITHFPQVIPKATKKPSKRSSGEEKHRHRSSRNQQSMQDKRLSAFSDKPRPRTVVLPKLHEDDSTLTMLKRMDGSHKISSERLPSSIPPPQSTSYRHQPFTQMSLSGHPLKENFQDSDEETSDVSVPRTQTTDKTTRRVR